MGTSFGNETGVSCDLSFFDLERRLSKAYCLKDLPSNCLVDLMMFVEIFWKEGTKSGSKTLHRGVNVLFIISTTKVLK